MHVYSGLFNVDMESPVEWMVKELDVLLENNLKLEKEINEFEKFVKESTDGEMRKLQEDGEKCQTELKSLQESSDGLLAKALEVEERFERVEKEQEREFETYGAVIQREQKNIDKLGCTLHGLQSVYMLMNDHKFDMAVPPCQFTLNNFHQQQQNDEVWYSPAFYTHPYGYSLRLQIHPNGHGTQHGTHLSVFVVVLAGNFDDLLSWPFCGSVHLEIENKATKCKCTVDLTSMHSLQCRTRPDDDVKPELRPSWTSNEQISHIKLKAGRSNHEYLTDDYVMCTVERVECFTPHY